ncbi:hypothetical protein BLNAU_14289 [Blattamonas nauphoetae]|uniref:Uncharacterized protein n=1 Tax=Blattamonas nauphoetae TaxID=2049346 RepID=A0ABQ9XHT6_9EUKA|nr:hypothetical protein BLNAU_14289 [Blattamonas nauphoetae]
MPTTTLPMFLEALLMIWINTNRLSQFLYLPEMEEVVETAETRLTDPANAIKITNGEFKCGSAPAIPLTQAEETALKKEAEQRKKEAKLAAAKETQVNPQSNKMQETEVSPTRTTITTERFPRSSNHLSTLTRRKLSPMFNIKCIGNFESNCHAIALPSSLSHSNHLPRSNKR